MAKDQHAARPAVDEPTGTAFVGHEWDGIEELNTPLPRWWLLTFYATIIWAAVYVILFPAWPLINAATHGVLGWSSRGQLAKELEREAKRKAPVNAAIAAAPVTQLVTDERLKRTAIEGGRAAFKVHCVQCHGSGAAGSRGYPNLNDDDWLWGGDIEAIHYSIVNGIRNPDHADTRQSQMPAFEGVLQPAEIGSVVAYVRTLSGLQRPDSASVQGAGLFATNCSSCHGPDGKGMREFGAPNLTDGIWLYGSDKATLTQTIRYARQGVMPRWNNRLDPVTIKMLATYVHSLGGGEASPARAMMANVEPR